MWGVRISGREADEFMSEITSQAEPPLVEYVQDDDGHISMKRVPVDRLRGLRDADDTLPTTGYLGLSRE